MIGQKKKMTRPKGWHSMLKHGRKNGGNSGRNPNGTFTAGNPGKPKGARHRSTRVALQLLDGEAEALTRKAVDLALAGDIMALRLCLERIAPPRKETPLMIDLPEIHTAADAVAGISAIITAAASGQITPTEGAAMTSLVEAHRRTLEVSELEARLAAMEERLEGNA